METMQEWLETHGACAQAVNWVGARSPEAAWNDCPYSSWLLWAAVRVEVDESLFAEVAVSAAKSVLHLIPEGERRPIRAVEGAEAWLKNPTRPSGWERSGLRFPEKLYDQAAAVRAYALYENGHIERPAALAAAAAANLVIGFLPKSYYADLAVIDAAEAMIAKTEAAAGENLVELPRHREERLQKTAADMVRDTITWNVVAEKLQA